MSTLFRYEARTPSGKIERGSLSAQGRQDALSRLYRRDLTPLVLQPEGNRRRAAILTDQAAHELSRTIAQLLRAGLSFAQALRFASDELAPAAAMAAARMREAAEAGDPPSSALDEYQGSAARLLQGVIQAGETSGKLADALDIAAATFKRSTEMRARMSTAMIYPSFVVAATLATLLCFMLFVVPSLAQAFSGAEERLPGSTRFLLASSAWLRANIQFMALGVGAGVVIVLSSPSAKRLLGRLLDTALLSPAGLGVASRLDYAAFASLSALSLEAGVASGPAFARAVHGVRSETTRNQLARAIAAMRAGERPSSALTRCARPPQSFLRLLHVGEETGRLADTLHYAATLLSSEAEQRLGRLGALAAPIMTLVLGGLVAIVVISLFLGLLSMSDLATT